MSVTWIIENYAKENSFKELIESVKRVGYPLIEINKDYKKELLYDLNKSTDKVWDLDSTSVYSLEVVEPKCVIVNGSKKCVSWFDRI